MSAEPIEPRRGRTTPPARPGPPDPEAATSQYRTYRTPPARPTQSTGSRQATGPTEGRRTTMPRPPSVPPPPAPPTAPIPSVPGAGPEDSGLENFGPGDFRSEPASPRYPGPRGDDAQRDDPGVRSEHAGRDARPGHAGHDDVDPPTEVAGIAAEEATSHLSTEGLARHAARPGEPAARALLRLVPRAGGQAREDGDGGAGTTGSTAPDQPVPEADDPPTIPIPIVDDARVAVDDAATGDGPTENGPTGNGPTGNGPTGNGPTGNGPTGNGPTGNGPTGNGPDVEARPWDVADPGPEIGTPARDPHSWGDTPTIAWRAAPRNQILGAPQAPPARPGAPAHPAARPFSARGAVAPPRPAGRATTPPTAASPVAAPPSSSPPASPSSAAVAPAQPAPGPRPEEQAARRVRETWVELEPREDEIARWFAALLFSIDPPLRALFPARVEGPARRLVRSMVLAMSTVDRPDELARLVEPLGREHRGIGLTAAAYESLGVALVGAVRRFADWEPATEHAWAQAFSLAALPLEKAAADPAPATVDATVVAHRRLTLDLAVITVEPEVAVAHRAGQYVSVEIPQRPRMWRHLSPATAPRPDGRLEFHVRGVEGGWVSRAMVAHAQVGDTWRIGPAQGRLEAGLHAGRDVLMIGGGTGAAPLLALCEELALRGNAPLTTVFLGGRRPEDLHCLDRFTALAHDSGGQTWLEVVPVCEQDPLSEATAPGTLPDAVVRAGDWSDHEVLLSGSPDMMRATVEALLVDGMSLDRIHYDPFTD